MVGVFERRELDERRSRSRVWAGIAASALLHASIAVVAVLTAPEEPQVDRVLEVQFVSPGEKPGPTESGNPEPPQPQPVTEPAPQSQPTSAPRVRPQPQPAPAPTPVDVPEAPQGTVATSPSAPAPAPEPSPPVDFATWQAQRMAKFMPSKRVMLGGGRPDGTDAVSSDGRDRCEPMSDRKVDRLYLLFDSSGSMTQVAYAMALSCADQYSRAVLRTGGEVVVGNFAKSITLSPATRDLSEVTYALREPSDNTATLLPIDQLDPYLSDNPDAVADIVILSDGYIANYREALPWYRYALELNVKNRGYLYSVGVPAQHEVARNFRAIGYDVYVYQGRDFAGLPFQ